MSRSPVYSDTLLVRMFHGSIAKPRFLQNEVTENASLNPDIKIADIKLNDKQSTILRPNVGGLWGGHVAMQIGDRVFGFYYKDANNIHLINKTPFNSEFHNYSIEEWEYIVAEKRETCFYIPATESELTELHDYFKHNCMQASMDYSFFGERCASNVYHLLIQLGKIPAGNYRLHAFWPAALRRTLIKHCGQNRWPITVKEGSKNEWWQGDISTFPQHPWIR
ncbi:MAG: hypothetical protein RLZZ252_1920 [Bacteroidota bacterium]